MRAAQQQGAGSSRTGATCGSRSSAASSRGRTRAQGGAPVDRHLRLVGQPPVEQLQEDPLRPPGGRGAGRGAGQDGAADQLPRCCMQAAVAPAAAAAWRRNGGCSFQTAA